MGVAGAEWLLRFKGKTPFEEGLRRTLESNEQTFVKLMEREEVIR